MIYASCPLRISLFGGSSDNPYYVEKNGYGSVISFTCDLKTYVTISQDRIGFNKENSLTIIEDSFNPIRHVCVLCRRLKFFVYGTKMK